MSLHNSPDHNTPEIHAAMRAHGIDPEVPSQVADAFRIGWISAQPGWEAQRCAECDCEHGGADCSWIRAPRFGEEDANG